MKPVVTVNPQVTNNPYPTVTGTVTDPAPSSGIKNVVVSMNGMPGKVAIVSGTTWSVTLTSQLADGPYTVTATATDNAGMTSDPATATITIHATPPVVQSIQTLDANPTNAASVHFTVTFSEPVTGVDPTDFGVVTTGGITSAAVTGVAVADSTNAVYTVTVSTGSGDGTLQLVVHDDNSIIDSYNNPLGGALVGDGDYAIGPFYTIDKTHVVTVLNGTTSIANGQTIPIDFGSVPHNAADPSKTFTIRNDGKLTLTLFTPFSSTAPFMVSRPAKTSLAPGQATTFTVTLDTSAVWAGAPRQYRSAGATAMA